MKALALTPGSRNLRVVDRSEPALTSPDEIKIRVQRVGICGTDREEASGGRAQAPAGRSELVIGHEMLGEVVEVGKQVKRVQPGDFAVFTVRRGCGKCTPCLLNRSDMCLTGEYRERGIWKLDGYQTEYVVDKEQYIVKVNKDLVPVGVLAEPLSVAEKAIDESVRIQTSRLPDAQATPNWLFGKRALVAGLGPIGLLAALALTLRGAQVYGLDVVDEGTSRPAWLAGIGGTYVDGRRVAANRLDDTLGPMDLIFEATGVPALAFNLLDALALNGVYVLTGIPGGNRPVQLPAAELIRQLVLMNQVMVGSVNAARDHFQMAVDDLALARSRWDKHVEGLITQRHPYTDFEGALRHHGDDEIKVVLEWVS